MIYGNIKFPEADLKRMEEAIQKAVNETGQSLKSAGQWAGRFVCGSLAASTRVAPKLRRIVRNPDTRWKTDRRRAPWGVMAPLGRERVMGFKPIYRTGEFGKIRFFDKKSMSWFRRDAANPKGKWESIPSGQDVANPELVAPGIKKDKRRTIRRRGLAKKVWQAAKTRMVTGGTLNGHGVSNIGRVVVCGDKNNPTLRIENNLRYAMDAFKTDGKQAVESTLRRAGDRMLNRVADKVAKQMGLT